MQPNEDRISERLTKKQIRDILLHQRRLMKSKPFYVEQFEKAKKIAIIVHQNADTDAIGSAISLKRIIKDNFDVDSDKEIDIFTDTAEFNKKDEDLAKTESINNQKYAKYDLAVALDTASRERLGIFDKIFKKAKDTLNIDHHATNNKYAKNNIVAPSCSSTCELLYLMFIKGKKYKYSPKTLSVLYSGIITDTDNLTQNLGRSTFRIIDEILQEASQNDIDLNIVRNHYFKNNTPEKNALLSRALDSLTYSDNGKIAMMKITKQDFAETGTTQADTLGIVDHAINTEGVEVGIIFIKQENNTYYVSLRSKSDSINVGEIARNMGGGGHDKVAAFCTTEDDSLTDIKAKLTTLCNEQFAREDKDEDDISSLFSEVEGEGPEDETEEVEEEKNKTM